MNTNFHAYSVILAVLTSACGGRVDVAEVDRERGRVNESDADAGSSDEITRDYSNYDPVCYDPAYNEYWETDAPNYYFEVLPTEGCTYKLTGDEDKCEGTWTCCDHTYTIRYERDLEAQVATAYFASSDRGDAGSKRWDESEQRETVPPKNTPTKLVPCLLRDEASPELSQAAALAAEWFGYTPAWEQAVREERGETVAADALPPIPLGCSLWMADYGCHVRMTCGEHEYEVRTGLEGELFCTRDGQSVTHVNDDYELVLSCDPENIYDVQTDACFGPGWNRYFELAARALK